MIEMGASPLLGGWVRAEALAAFHRAGRLDAGGRVDKPGAPRRRSGSGIWASPPDPDFHAVGVMAAILGGLFNSRLNMKLREEKGYTYGAGAGFDLRRAAGPFSARAAVNTEVTAAALADLVAELDRICSERVTDAELAPPGFLIGVFPPGSRRPRGRRRPGNGHPRPAGR